VKTATERQFTGSDAKQARQSYQHLAAVVNRIVNRLARTLPEADAKKFLKPTVPGTIHSLHGLFHGRDLKKKNLILAHKFVVPHFDYRGDPENAARFMDRRLDALALFETAVGRRLIQLTRADNKTLLFTSYEGHPLLDAAEWVYLQARQKADYWKNASAAVTDDLLDEAIQMLPEVVAPVAGADAADVEDSAEGERWESADLMASAVVKGMWTKIINSAASALEKEFDTGSDPELAAARAANKILELGKAIKATRAREVLRAVMSPGTRDDVADSNGKNNVPSPAGGSPVEEVATLDKNVVGSFCEVIENKDDDDMPEKSTEGAMLEWALFWARQGVAVFPVHTAADGACSCSRGAECKSAGKHPKTATGLKEATTDERQIVRWWGRWPDANIGGATGGAIRLLVVDVDPKSGGDASLCDLVEAHGGEWLNTLHVETGSLGSHFFYTYPADVELRNSAGALAPGIDTRAEGGYVVLPPSLHVSGRRYRLKETVTIQPAPVWIIEEFTRPAEQKPSVVVNFQERRTRRGGGSCFAEGERNHGLFRVGCAIWGGGQASDIADLHQQLLQVNVERCSPPLDDAEVAQIVGSIQRYPRGVPISQEAMA
jgi:hypothetical protein